MHSHEQARLRASNLASLAQSHNISALVGAANKHASHVKAASDAFHSGDLPAMKVATSAMLRSAADAVDATPADAPAEVIEAGRDALKHLGIGLAASN